MSKWSDQGKCCFFTVTSICMGKDHKHKLFACSCHSSTAYMQTNAKMYLHTLNTESTTLLEQLHF